MVTSSDYRDCSVLFLDVRNFTTLMEIFSSDDSFYNLIKQVYSNGESIAISFSREASGFYINSTGDGFVLIYFGEHHETKAFLTSLVLLKWLEPCFESFFKDKNDSNRTEGSYYFGIGIESGTVREVSSAKSMLKTYLGDTINLAARIESLSKGHGRAPILYGPSINDRLTKLYHGCSYFDLTESAKRAPSKKEAEEIHNKMIKINRSFLSSYIFEHRIKGSKEFLPIFRFSPTELETAEYKPNIMNKNDDLWFVFIRLLEGSKVPG